MPRSQEAKRERVEQRVRAKLALLAFPWLPMSDQEYPGATKLSEDEWVEYRERREWHLGLSDYDAGWARPTGKTAEEVWTLLTPHLDFELEDIVPTAQYLTGAERRELEITAKQALVVVLDAFVYAEKITYKEVLDAVVTRWSDNFRHAPEAFWVRHLRRTTWTTTRRDLIRNGVRLGAIWNRVIKWSTPKKISRVNTGRVLKDASANPLFSVHELYAGPTHRNYRIDPKPGSLLTAFEDCLLNDKVYQQRRPAGSRILFADDETPPRTIRRDVVAERASKVAVIGEASERALALLEQTRLQVNVEEIRADYDRATAAIQKMSGAARPIRERVTTLVLPVMQALHRRKSPVLIKTGYERAVNRRFHPTSFWPVGVSGKTSIWDEPDAPSMRARWFRDRDGVELVGLDVSSSVTQILALVLGLRDLEVLACNPEMGFNRYLAQEAWKLHEATAAGIFKGGYTGANDKQLRDTVKNLWMRVLYGSPTSQVVFDQRDDPKTYGPGWASAGSAAAFLKHLPQYRGVREFLTACRRISKGAEGRGEGVVLIDPLDSVVFEWNPVQCEPYPVSSDGHKVFLDVPGQLIKRVAGAAGWRKGERVKGHKVWVESGPSDPQPVDYRSLRKMVAPCLVHSLDAYFAALVVQGLAARGVRDIVAVHDAFLVPKTVSGRPGVEILSAVIEEASVTWFKGLRPVYDRLGFYLGADKRFGGYVPGMRATWEARVRGKDWPCFVASP